MGCTLLACAALALVPALTGRFGGVIVRSPDAGSASDRTIYTRRDSHVHEVTYHTVRRLGRDTRHQQRRGETRRTHKPPARGSEPAGRLRQVIGRLELRDCS
eukprot:5937849-Prymnesium_polylepis.1